MVVPAWFFLNIVNISSKLVGFSFRWNRDNFYYVYMQVERKGGSLSVFLWGFAHLTIERWSIANVDKGNSIGKMQTEATGTTTYIGNYATETGKGNGRVRVRTRARDVTHRYKELDESTRRLYCQVQNAEREKIREARAYIYICECVNVCLYMYVQCKSGNITRRKKKW